MQQRAGAESLSAGQYTVRVLMGMAIYLTLLPMIVAIALREFNFLAGVAFGLGVSGVLVATHTGLYFFKMKKVSVSSFLGALLSPWR